MIFREIEDRVAAIGNSAEAEVLVQELMTQVAEFKLEMPERVSIVRATLATILDVFIRDNRVTKLHPGHLAELLLEPLDAPVPVKLERTRRIQI